MKWILMLYLINGDAGPMITDESYCIQMVINVEAGDFDMKIETSDGPRLIVRAECLGPVRADISTTGVSQ